MKQLLDRLKAIYFADMTGVKVVMAVVAYMWSLALLVLNVKIAAQWPLLSLKVWGMLWFAYATAKTFQLIHHELPYAVRMTVNMFGVFLTASWEFAYISIGLFTPAPFTFMPLSMWLLMRTRKD